MRSISSGDTRNKVALGENKTVEKKWRLCSLLRARPDTPRPRSSVSITLRRDNEFIRREETQEETITGKIKSSDTDACAECDFVGLLLLRRIPRRRKKKKTRLRHREITHGLERLFSTRRRLCSWIRRRIAQCFLSSIRFRERGSPLVVSGVFDS